MKPKPPVPFPASAGKSPVRGTTSAHLRVGTGRIAVNADGSLTYTFTHLPRHVPVRARRHGCRGDVWRAGSMAGHRLATGRFRRGPSWRRHRGVRLRR